MGERRRFERHAIQVPVNVSTKVRQNRVGVIRDVSASGVLFHSRSRFALGERLTIQFRIRKDKSSTAGRVVRAGTDQRDDAFFPYLTAVQFDAPLLDLPLDEGGAPGSGEPDTDVDHRV
jgi:hypothetical protein